MQRFLTHLFTGIKEVPKKFSYLLEDSILKEAIEIKKNHVVLKQGFDIGKIELGKHRQAFLISLGIHYAKDPILKGFPKNIAPNALVLCSINSRRKRPIARYIATLSIKTHSIVCYLTKMNQKIVALSFKDPTKTPIFLKHSQKSLLELPKHCVIKINLKERKIEEILGVLEDPLIDERLSLELFQRQLTFSKDALDLAQNFSQMPAQSFMGYKDYTHMPFCTIDPITAKDFDDAIFYDKDLETLYVAIADVSAFVPLHSVLDTESRARGFSVYFPNSVYPMLPPSLSQGTCSLKAKEKRLALVWEIPLKDTKDAKLVQAMIEVRANTSYKEIEEFFNNPTTCNLSKEIQESLLGFLPLALELKKVRLKKGFDFMSDKRMLCLDKEGRLENLALDKEGIAHSVVEEAMLLANQSSARLLDKALEGKGIYRVHEKPTLEQQKRLNAKLFSYGFERNKKMSFHHFLHHVLELAKEKGLENEVGHMMIKAQQEARYSPFNEGHFGLGFSSYTHFTSPIRRYSDLMLHRILKELLFGNAKKLAYLLEETMVVCSELNALQKNVALIERDFRKRKFARYALEHINEEFLGIILENKDFMVVALKEKLIGAKVLVKSKYSFEILEKVRLKITQADLILGEIRGEIIQKGL
ncbi:RNB domain-containing ribonuclease [Helicobacter cetorum]|uniref:RNB domain-containing ribonuclease n=1 Tax=Helicobacter cetorum TaxID=138563 RepID=UPI000CF10265|nr:ribonuclease R family protein [Helicobacter cetorum]